MNMSKCFMVSVDNLWCPSIGIGGQAAEAPTFFKKVGAKAGQADENFLTNGNASLLL